MSPLSRLRFSLLVHKRAAGRIRSERSDREFLGDDFGASVAGHVEENCQRLAQGFGPRVGYGEVAPAEVHGVITLVVHPQVAVDGLGYLVGASGVGCGLLLVAHYACYFGEGAPCLCVHHRGAERFGGVYVGGLHPSRIRLFAPVDERGLASDQPGGLVAHHGVVVFKRAANHGVYLFKPLARAGGLVHFEGGDGPYLAVGAHGPSASRAGILYDASVGGDFMLERYTRDLRLQGGHGEDYRI